MKTIDWKSDTEFAVDDVHFKCVLGDYGKHKTSKSQIILLKNKGAISRYEDYFRDAPPARVLEFGTYEGGSPVLMSLLFELQKFVGIDLRRPVPELQKFLDNHPVGQAISLHYNVSQDDGSAIRSIVDSEFRGDPIDLIIDDASHQLALSRRTFEIAFPMLRPGGTYLLEDWGWAHWPQFNNWHDKPALSNLVFQLVALCAGHAELIASMLVFPAFLFVRKARTAASTNDELFLNDLVGQRAARLAQI